MAHQKELTISTRMEDLHQVEKAVDALAEELGWSLKLTNQVQLVLEELVVNVIHYGHEVPDDLAHKIFISMIASDEKLVLEIKDDGVAFDPLREGPTVNMESNIDDRKIGGLGIHLVRKLSNEIVYQREGEMNKLTIVKFMEEDSFSGDC